MTSQMIILGESRLPICIFCYPNSSSNLYLLQRNRIFIVDLKSHQANNQRVASNAEFSPQKIDFAGPDAHLKTTCALRRSPSRFIIRIPKYTNGPSQRWNCISNFNASKNYQLFWLYFFVCWKRTYHLNYNILLVS